MQSRLKNIIQNDTQIRLDARIQEIIKDCTAKNFYRSSLDGKYKKIESFPNPFEIDSIRKELKSRSFSNAEDISLIVDFYVAVLNKIYVDLHEQTHISSCRNADGYIIAYDFGINPERHLSRMNDIFFESLTYYSHPNNKNKPKDFLTDYQNASEKLELYAEKAKERNVPNPDFKLAGDPTKLKDHRKRLQSLSSVINPDELPPPRSRNQFDANDQFERLKSAYETQSSTTMRANAHYKHSMPEIKISTEEAGALHIPSNSQSLVQSKPPEVKKKLLQFLFEKFFKVFSLDEAKKLTKDTYILVANEIVENLRITSRLITDPDIDWTKEEKKEAAKYFYMIYEILEDYGWQCEIKSARNLRPSNEKDFDRFLKTFSGEINFRYKYYTLQEQIASLRNLCNLKYNPIPQPKPDSNHAPSKATLVQITPKKDKLSERAANTSVKKTTGDMQGYTPLLAACSALWRTEQEKQNIVNKVKLLLSDELKIDLNAQRKTHPFSNALACAASTGNIEVVELLLARGATLNVANVDYELALKQCTLDETIKNKIRTLLKLPLKIVAPSSQLQSLGSATVHHYSETRQRVNLFNNTAQNNLQQVGESFSAQRILQNNLTQNGLVLGDAYSDGDCFFDAIAQALEKSGIALPLSPLFADEPAHRILRRICLGLARLSRQQYDSWLAPALTREGDSLENYINNISYTAQEMELRQSQGLSNHGPIWGRQEIEGRLLCIALNIRLHFIEIHHPESQAQLLHILVNEDGMRDVREDEIATLYDDNRTLHIACYQRSLHFVPILKNSATPVNRPKITAPKTAVNTSVNSPTPVTPPDRTFYQLMKEVSNMDNTLLQAPNRAVANKRLNFLNSNLATYLSSHPEALAQVATSPTKEQNDYGLSLITACALYNTSESIMRSILIFADPSKKLFNNPIEDKRNPYHGWNALALAVKFRNIKAIKVLLENNALPQYPFRQEKMFKAAVNTIQAFLDMESVITLLHDQVINTEDEVKQSQAILSDTPQTPIEFVAETPQVSLAASTSSDAPVPMDIDPVEPSLASHFPPPPLIIPSNNFGEIARPSSVKEESVDSNKLGTVKTENSALPSSQFVDMPKLETAAPFSLNVRSEPEIESTEYAFTDTEDQALEGGINLFIKVRDSLIDPITQEVMHDPVILVQTGGVCDRESLKIYFQSQGVGARCLRTNLVVNDQTVTPCLVSRAVLEAMGSELAPLPPQIHDLEDLPNVIVRRNLEAMCRESLGRRERDTLINRAAILSPQVPASEFMKPEITHRDAIRSIYLACQDIWNEFWFTKYFTQARMPAISAATPGSNGTASISSSKLIDDLFENYKNENEKCLSLERIIPLMPYEEKTQLRMQLVEFFNKIHPLIRINPNDANKIMVDPVRLGNGTVRERSELPDQQQALVLPPCRMTTALLVAYGINNQPQKPNLPKSISPRDLRAIKGAFKMSQAEISIEISRMCQVAIKNDIFKDGTDNPAVIQAIYQLCVCYGHEAVFRDNTTIEAPRQVISLLSPALTSTYNRTMSEVANLALSAMTPPSKKRKLLPTNATTSSSSQILHLIDLTRDDSVTPTENRAKTQSEATQLQAPFISAAGSQDLMMPPLVRRISQTFNFGVNQTQRTHSPEAEITQTFNLPANFPFSQMASLYAFDRASSTHASVPALARNFATQPPKRKRAPRKRKQQNPVPLVGQQVPLSSTSYVLQSASATRRWCSTHGYGLCPPPLQRNTEATTGFSNSDTSYASVGLLGLPLAFFRQLIPPPPPLRPLQNSGSDGFNPDTYLNLDSRPSSPVVAPLGSLFSPPPLPPLQSRGNEGFNPDTYLNLDSRPSSPVVAPLGSSFVGPAPSNPFDNGLFGLMDYLSSLNDEDVGLMNLSGTRRVG